MSSKSLSTNMQSASEHSLEKRASTSAIETAPTQADALNSKVESDDAKPASTSVIAGPKFEVPNLNKLFFKKLAISAILITLVFWVNLTWMLGSYYDGSQYVYKAKMLIVDYDGSSAGEALLAAVNAANGPGTNPTYEIASSDSYTADEVKQAVFKGKYWGAAYATANSTQVFGSVIVGTNTSEYVPQNAYVLLGNSARYTAFYPSVVLDNLEAIAADAKTRFIQQTSLPLITNALSNGTTLSEAQVSTIFDPVDYTYIDTSYGSFTFGDRMVFNTLMIVVVVLCQFFFLMSLNGLTMAFGRLHTISTLDYFKVRLPISTAWACFAGLCLTAWQMIFRESYPINARLFFSLWTLYLAFSMIVFDVLDILTAFVPQQYMSFCMFTWMITNVSSAGSPVELSNNFYRISYFFPAHSMWLAEQHIWSQGGAYPLSLSLPILAAWLVVAKMGTLFTLKPRRKAAAAAKAAGAGGRGGGRGGRGARGA
ncbi:uncharacterized protein BHQ10_005153 [Talaromyces amestolkiae]|uniref:DUF3533 domain-containing protein n=1 Tax=Talaromyces amestolkiae TaxID=1196081 RepID=A0A364L067_TALAM|nr:uncharacterized protein BHQ10_005153 [Talaromyces amestolkiae]RAO69141.1 hypothetical protein BHQ10_005153 [Talaromyces amestolkiae]